MTHAAQHCGRPWWKRPPVWFIGIAAVLLFFVIVIEQSDRQATIPYSAFLDQVEAGNVASVSFQGTEINARLKRPLDGTLPAGAAQRSSFRSRVPDFGDPALIPDLRRHQVTIDVASPSPWAWLLGRVPWPMLILVGAMLVAGLVRLVRGGNAQPGSATSTLPTHGMMGLVAKLFAKQQQSASPPTHDSDEPKRQ